MQIKLLVDKQYYEQVVNPYFLVKDGCIFFSSHFNKKDYQQWKKIEQSKEKLERTINHIHLADLVDNYGNQFKLGRKIEKIWQDRLAVLFPQIKFELKLNTVFIERKKELILDLNVKPIFRNKIFKIKDNKECPKNKERRTHIKRVIPINRHN